MVDLIPRVVLFGNPERLAPAVSPDGRRLEHIAPVDGVLNVWVGTLGDEDAAPVTSDRERGVRSFLWCDDNRHIVYPQDIGGDENWHLRVIDLEAGGDRDLTPFEGVQARILGHDRRQPNHLLVGLNRDDPELHDAYLLDVRDGTLELVAKNPGFAECSSMPTCACAAASSSTRTAEPRSASATPQAASTARLSTSGPRTRS